MSNKAYKYRIYPTPAQEQWLAKNFGCCRKVYNIALDWKIKAYQADKTSLTYNDLATALPSLKKCYPYLREADSASLQQTIRHLFAGFDSFYAHRGGYPKFKSRRSRQSYSTPVTNGNVRVLGSAVVLPKLGPVKAVIHRKAPADWTLKSATVSRDRDGRYFVSVLYAFEAAAMSSVTEPAKVLGLDYKSNGLFADSEGRVADMPHYYRSTEERLARAQRKLSRRKGSRKGEAESNNHKKQRLRVAKLHAHVRNQRLDYLHKESRRIADDYDLVCVEDLNLRAIGRHHKKGLHLGKSVSDNGYGTFLSLLDYKLADQGKALVKVDRFYASSQFCHACGYKNLITKDLTVRRVVCPVCGTSYDRDVNAAENIRDEGFRQYMRQDIKAA